MNVKLLTIVGVCLCLMVALAFYYLAWLGNVGGTLAQEPTTFTGDSFKIDNEGVNLTRRGFDAGARSHWHVHGQDQLLFVQEGRMRYQMEGDRMKEIDLHESTYLDGGVAHWHGSVPDQGSTQVSVTFEQDDPAGFDYEWLEAVTDEQYEGTSNR